jgi:hypothetical protein
MCEAGNWKCDAVELFEAFEPAAIPPALWPRAVSSAIIPFWPQLHVGAREQVDAETRQSFERLVSWWREETALTSSITEMVMHPAYQRIIGMGRSALPLILHELHRESGHWFWALRAITGEDPVRSEDAGDIERMSEAWLELARRRGWL